MGKKLIYIFISLVLCQFAVAQAPMPFDSLLNKLKKFDKTYVQEKIHIHFDKPFYCLGDTIWFACYVVDASANKPSDWSKIVHVELINEKDSICLQGQFIADVGFAPGDFVLPKNFTAGIYKVRAYTNWMRNFDQAYFFRKNIAILNPFLDNRSTLPNLQRDGKHTGNISVGYDVQFFPESGRLLAGIKSTVAFKVKANNGASADISGILTDQHNNVVLSFKTLHAGIGTFDFIPQKGNHYIATLKYPDGSSNSISLPDPELSGYTITADNNNPDSLFIQLRASPDLLNKEELVFMPLSNGIPQFVLKTKFPDSRVNITVPKNRLPGGMLQLSLFNADSKPIAERLVFNDYLKKITIVPDGLQENYKTKENTHFVISATDIHKRPVSGRFSITVINTDELKTAGQSEVTIFSNLLLTSDLKGYVENPNYYFTEASVEKNKALDNLLLTQNWSRFDWNKVKTGASLENSFKPEQELSITGIILNEKNKPVSGTQVYLLPEQKTSGSIQNSATGSDGQFSFAIPVSQAGNSFILQTKQAQFTIRIHPYASAPVTYTTCGPAQMMLNDSTGIYARATADKLMQSGNPINLGNAQMLKEVIVKDYTPRNKLSGNNSTSANLNGKGHADKVFVAKDIEKWKSLADLDGQLPGARVINNGGKSVITLTSNFGTHIPNALVLVDGQEGLSLDDIAPMDVESIEFLKSIGYIGIYGLKGSGGVLLITTKKGTEGVEGNDVNSKSNMLRVSSLAYHLRSFNSPVYDNKLVSGNELNDLRTTVYWNPEIITGSDGKAAISYYNNNKKGNYKIIIEGIDAGGDLCRQIFVYKVE